MHKWAVGVFACQAAAACYYPDGSNAAKDYKYEPCGNSTTTYSSCCYFGEGDKCLANGLCNQPGKWDYRASCQNKDWSNCPEVCMDSESGTWFPLTTCGKNKYCCPPADGSDCCDSGAQIYTLQAPDPSSKTKSSSATSTFQSVIRTTIIQTSTPGADRGDSSVKSLTPAIVGGTVGGVTFFGFLFLGVFCVYKRRDRPAKPHITMIPNKKDDGPSDKVNATVQVVPQIQIGVAEAEGTEGNRYTETEGRPVNIPRPPLAYPEDDGMPQPADVTLPQQPYPENDGMPRAGRPDVHGLRSHPVRANTSTEADSNPILHADSNSILHADSNPILHADSNPILQADSNPILQADSNPINEAPDDAWVRPRNTAVPKNTAHELP
ncbi:hypothetical protein F53441_6132 [Fusarium austroafricanum]|uniref:Uncharacterized protein n=1 Tax=Fusarium austroafricanum TaxID=2364996 RepID=A0A8H4KIK4_9HYPO|nr:hypothetical protein F53441_6132 [Fusarium austroafricanum]